MELYQAKKEILCDKSSNQIRIPLLKDKDLSIWSTPFSSKEREHESKQALTEKSLFMIAKGMQVLVEDDQVLFQRKLLKQNNC